MRCVADTVNVLELNRRFHDEVEAGGYDARMGVTHDPDSVKRMMIEFESARGAGLRGSHVVDVGGRTDRMSRPKMVKASGFMPPVWIPLGPAAAINLMRHKSVDPILGFRIF